jgi:hypothetical protein
MKCPVCRVDLVMADRAGVEIDYCSKCRGVWLDRGELDKIVERSATDAPDLGRGVWPDGAAAETEIVSRRAVRLRLRHNAMDGTP